MPGPSDKLPLFAIDDDDLRDHRDFDWSGFVDKVTQSALVLVLAKLVAAWVVAALWNVPIRSRMAWGFVPFAGLETTGAQFRSVAAWSTTIVAAVAVIWVVVHIARRRKRPLAVVYGAFAALPMAAVLTGLEWWRRFDGDHLVPGRAALWILLFVAIPMVLFLGFIESPAERRRADVELVRHRAVEAATAALGTAVTFAGLQPVTMTSANTPTTSITLVADQPRPAPVVSVVSVARGRRPISSASGVGDSRQHFAPAQLNPVQLRPVQLNPVAMTRLLPELSSVGATSSIFRAPEAPAVTAAQPLSLSSNH